MPSQTPEVNNPGAIAWRTLLAEGADLPANEVRWIVERVSGYDGGELTAHLDETPLARQVGFFDALIARRSAGEPLQYVLGRWPFRSLELLVDRRVLIPRPETEFVTGIAIDHLRAYGPEERLIVCDLGTGSGAIGLSIAKEVVHTEVWCTDISEDALAVARANLAGLGRAAARVRIAQGSWFEALPDELQGRFACVVSNPPYVAIADEVDSVVTTWEPHQALYGGDDGADHLRMLIDDATSWLAPGGQLICELGPGHAGAVAEYASGAGFVDVAVHRDLAGRDRALTARVR